jgi:hypothetical protein
MSPHVRRFVIIALLLGAVALVARAPENSDRSLYVRMGQQGIVLDCSDIHCFRPLVPFVVERLPGPSPMKWKLYAVLTSAAAAVATGRLCLVLGLSARAAGFATWIAAFGFGPLNAVFDPYTADPLMYFLGPWLTADLLRRQLGRATLLASLGVLGKEFAAAPMWMFALLTALQRRWQLTARATLSATTATLVWFALHTILMTLFNYTYGPNPSVDLFGGGYLRSWIAALGPSGAIVALLATSGPIVVLMAAGLRRSDSTLRLLAVSAIPAAAAFAYVQQPDRALWNFAFVAVPIAVLALAESSNVLCWLFVVCYGVGNLRLGVSQPPFFPAFRAAMIAIAMGVAVLASITSLKRERPAST